MGLKAAGRIDMVAKLWWNWGLRMKMMSIADDDNQVVDLIDDYRGSLTEL